MSCADFCSAGERSGVVPAHDGIGVLKGNFTLHSHAAPARDFQHLDLLELFSLGHAPCTLARVLHHSPASVTVKMYYGKPRKDFCLWVQNAS
jgi:hypothetical protein